MNVGSGGGAAAAPAAGGAASGDAAADAPKEEEKEEGTDYFPVLDGLYGIANMSLQPRRSLTRIWVSVSSTKQPAPRVTATVFSLASLYFNCMALRGFHTHRWMHTGWSGRLYPASWAE